MPNTSKGYPYPEDTDAADVPADVQLLAEAVDGAPGIASLSQVQIDALTAGQKWAGRVVWNQTTNKLQRSDGSAFTDLVITSDSRLSDARTPVAHKSSHASAGSDPLSPSDIGAIPSSIVTAKGDLLGATGSGTVARVPVGANGQVLTADSAQSSGMKWADPAALGNIDGGDPSSVYGGITNIDAGGVS